MRIELAKAVLLFFIYGFLGWCVEVAFAACKSGRFVNRGFLNGPICPIYGFGVMAVAVLLQPVRSNPWLLYLGAFLLTSLLELITGWLLEKIFHAKWWDYSKMPLNIGGYVCLLFSLIWGFACMAIVRWVHPLFRASVSVLPNLLVYIFDVLLLALLVADLIATIATIHKLQERVRALNEIALEIRDLSNNLGENIAEKTLDARKRWSERLDQERERYENMREARVARLQELRVMMEERLNERSFGHRRILEAFPNLKSAKHSEGLARLKEFWRNRKKGHEGHEDINASR